MRRLVSAALFVLAGAAHAELVATGFYKITSSDMLVAELSDQQRPSESTEPSQCEKEGKRMVLASVGDMRTFPRIIPYASGCWHFTDDSIILELRTLRDRKPLTLRMPLADFDTTPKFTRWADYRLKVAR